MYRSSIVTAAVLVAVFLGATAGKASASGVLVSFDPGTTQRVSEVLRYPVFGDLMAGMEVTAEFVGGGSETVSWAATGPNAGAATGSGWSLVVTGHTYFPGGSWTLSTTSAALSRLTLDGKPGDTAFDIFWGSTGDDEGTLGSYLGRTFTVTSTPGGVDILATYVDEVALVGEEPVGDLYRSLDIRFINPEGLGTGETLIFRADTDNVVYAPPPAPPNPVPEPATLFLLGAGAAATALGLRRRAARKRAP